MSPVRAPKQSRSRATYDAILESATRILVESGWQAVNTNAVAERAGVSIGSLYEYFPNKEAIIDAIAMRHINEGKELFSRTAETLPSMRTTHRLVEALVSAIVSVHQGSPDLHRKLSSEVPLSVEVKQEVQQLRQSILTAIAALLSTEVNNPGLVAQILYDSSDAVVHKWYVEESGKDVENEVLKNQLILMLNAYLETLKLNRAEV